MAKFAVPIIELRYNFTELVYVVISRFLP